MTSVACPICEGRSVGTSSECPHGDQTLPEGEARRPSPSARSPGYCDDAIAALLLAVAALIVWPMAILAVVYGAAALTSLREQRDEQKPVQKGRWMATTALAVSVIAVPFSIAAILVL